MSKNFMTVNRIMYPGDYIKSNNGKFKAIFQEDGNFVVYPDLHTAIWSSHTQNQGAIKLIMQSDGNLVIYKRGAPLWASGTCGQGNGNNNVAFLRLTDDGILVLTAGDDVVWKSQ
ncbi:hypothetical protein UPYG_G00154240 [Umbra pygmaea]|uniref:Bulb-type lectin domain-containing protein n=1 Tax=Umbra pygmaea TaxID=75934 RepID=A0ABD0X1Y4_UMBPY